MSLPQRWQEERGFAMVAVTLMGLVVLAFGFIIVLNADRGSRESLQERRWSEALVVAESGLDRAKFEVRQNWNYAVTSVPGMPGSFTSPTAEKAFILDFVSDRVAGGTPLPVLTAEGGEYVLVRPSGTASLYSIGYVPNQASALEIRVLEATIAVEFPPPLPVYSPSLSLTSGGNISMTAEIKGSVGGVHANGNLTGSGSVTGCATSGPSPKTNSFGPPIPPCANHTETIPDVKPQDFHVLATYDLCKSGSGQVRKGPAWAGPVGPNADFAPCTGSVVATPAGWSYSSGKWNYGGGSSGVFYAHEADVDYQGDSGPEGVTIIASATLPTGGACSGSAGGSIAVAGGRVLVPYLTVGDLALVAGRDIEARGGGEVYGVMLAHEQVSLGGNPGPNNAVIAEPTAPCDHASSPVHATEVYGSTTVTFTGQLVIPIYGQIQQGPDVTVKRWDEL